MINFNLEQVDMFLGVIRKYMQIRGGLSQKELAELVNVGISTMSRFLNKKTKEMDPQLIATMVARLNIPLYEIIEFVEEDSTDKFKKLVAFYKEQEVADNEDNDASRQVDSAPDLSSFEEQLDDKNTRSKSHAYIGGVKVPFGERRSQDPKNLSIREKLNQLSPRQKGFLTDFLDLDVEGRDLIVDVGNSLFRYFKQKNAEF